jgi:hypothetical protein
MLERCGYTATLYLSALIAAANGSAFFYSQWFLPRAGDGFAFHAIAALLILLGLWLFSRIARYAGAVFYFLSAGAATYALWKFAGLAHVGAVWAATMAVLGLAGTAILVFSKQFAREFAAGRERRPAYKKYLLHAFTLVIIIAAAGSVLIDVFAFVEMTGK